LSASDESTLVAELVPRQATYGKLTVDFTTYDNVHTGSKEAVIGSATVLKLQATFMYL